MIEEKTLKEIVRLNNRIGKLTDVIIVMTQDKKTDSRKKQWADRILFLVIGAVAMFVLLVIS